MCRFLVTLQLPAAGLATAGVVRGVPMYNTAKRFFFALEHPMSATGPLASSPSLAICGIVGLPRLDPGQLSFPYTTVAGRR